MTLPQFNQLPDASATQSPFNECDGTLWIISPKESVNLCTNPSFETNTTNWAQTAPTTIGRIADPWSGAYGLSWTTTPGMYLTYGGTTQFDLIGYGNYAISFYCYSSTANATSTITVEVMPLIGATPTAQTSEPITASWRRVVLNMYVPVLTAGLHTVRISVNQSMSVIIDAVQIEQINQDGVNLFGTVNQGATTYFDGSTTGTINNSQATSPQYTWQGKAHESASSRSIGAANGGTPINLQNALGFTIIGVIGGGNPAPNNQTVSFNGVDGGSLVDILIPPRELTMIGRISATSKESLARKISGFLEHFGRDTTAIRQAKYFIFQYKRGRELIGQPLYFSGIVTNTANAPVSNDLAYTVSMTINMLDPFFYGHTESFSLPVSDLNQIDSSLSYVPDFTKTSSNALFSAAQTLYDANGSIRAMVVAPNGEIYIGGDFTQFDGAANTAYIVRYSPITKTYTGLRPGADALNGYVSALAITPDGADLWIGGAFTTANGVAANYIVRYTIATGVWSTYGAGAGGGVAPAGSVVYAIAINRMRKVASGGGYPYDVYIGGKFTATTTLTPLFRIAKTSSTSNVWQQIGTGNGMNGEVYALAYNNNLNRLYIGGSFTTSQAGATNAFVGICYINASTLGTTIAFYTGVNVATGGYVYSIYSSDVDNALYIGGSFTSTFAGAALLRAASFNGVVWNQVDFGFSDGIVYDFQPYNNGFLLTGTFTSGGGYSGLFNGTAYYNGQTLAPVPVSGLGKGFYNSIVTPDNALYLGLIRTVNQTIASGQVQKYVYKGTAAAAMVWQIYHNDPAVYDFVLNQIANLTQQTAVSFKQLPITYKEFVQINTATGTITSDMMGNQLRYILGSGITVQRIMPGNNYLMYWYVTTATYGASIDIAAFWRKTYYTLFDGVNAT